MKKEKDLIVDGYIKDGQIYVQVLVGDCPCMTLSLKAAFHTAALIASTAAFGLAQENCDQSIADLIDDNQSTDLDGATKSFLSVLIALATDL